MTDYQPLIARAVEGLERNSGEARRALYERARTALVAQLRAVEPALPESEITKQRLALEEAIRKVEAEASRKARAETRQQLRPAPREHRETAPAPHAAEPAAVETQRPAVSTARERLLNARARSPTQEGLKGFRDVASDVRDLGGATAKAAQIARHARDSYGAGAIPHHTPHVDELPETSAHDDVAPQPEADAFDSVGDDAQHDHLSLHSLEPSYGDEEPAAPQAPRPQPRATAEQEFQELRPPRSYRGLIKLAVAAVVLLGAMATLSWQWSTIAGLYHFFVHRGPPPSAQATQAVPAPPKFSGRVPQQQNAGAAPGAGAAGSQTAPAAMVAQRVVLYEEDPKNPQGRRYVGSVVWRTETVSPGPGLAPEIAVRANVTIPEKHMTMTWSLRRNTDKALPASHTIEIMFTLPSDFPGGGIGNVPGILMKDSEQARGTPLAGLAVKVTSGYFLIGLSAVNTDMQRNIDLLKDRQWFDIPIVYSNGGRAILAMEKGPPGDRAFAEAFAAWQKK